VRSRRSADDPRVERDADVGLAEDEPGYDQRYVGLSLTPGVPVALLV
jgi:hypothetical protein